MDSIMLCASSRQLRSDIFLSICIPFYGYDVSLLLRELLEQAGKYSNELEIILFDDGSNYGNDYVPELLKLIRSSEISVRLYRSEKNIGRAAARNFLGGMAYGAYILFLDADMLPDSRNYLAYYMSIIKPGQVALVVGGRSYERLDMSSICRENRLYLYYSMASECLTAEERQIQPERYLFTNNFVIRRDIFILYPMDNSFKGWGYEDIDWALELNKAGIKILHVNNTATHFGLIGTTQLLRKYESSVNNLCMLIAKNTDQAIALPVCRYSLLLSQLNLPFQYGKRFFSSMIKTSFFPLRIRIMLLQGFKLCIYAQALKSKRKWL